MGTQEEAFVQLAKGGASMGKFASYLFKYFNDENEKKVEDIILPEIETKKDRVKAKAERQQRNNPGITVKGADNLMIRIARCCNPVPGDDIVGFITKGRGISVHRKDCSNIKSMPESEKGRFIDVEWESLKEGKSYNADICVVGIDRKGIFSDISRTCEDMDVNISGVNAKSGKDETVNITLTLSITSTQQMEKILRRLRLVDGVNSVYRAKS